MQPSGDPVPSVGEAEATGEIAELYADIRETLGMSFVNLIWRNIASIPGGLRWTRETMKPLYTNGAVYGQADALREAQDLPTVPGSAGPPCGRWASTLRVSRRSVPR
ncbi:hypothetical protein MJO63_19265 [Mycobacterium ulcerans]|uniref:Uncharacterized protein n=1 Tax=Mycobacterium ulcerans TaxID=1809 RepID=A0ABY3V9A0_MYCUL|nr:hypothetical protein [Mycobacterium ulcerans]UDM33663.1 hypothetical protein LH162_19300 [Mycobacterium ulcerans]ULP50993.1 hypothetical protein MJO63_19265 [Mycobacterium ulcerans]